MKLSRTNLQKYVLSAVLYGELVRLFGWSWLACKKIYTYTICRSTLWWLITADLLSFFVMYNKTFCTNGICSLSMMVNIAGRHLFSPALLHSLRIPFCCHSIKNLLSSPITLFKLETCCVEDILRASFRCCNFYLLVLSSWRNVSQTFQ